MAHVYRAGPTVIFLRMLQGSAIITTSSQAGESFYLGLLLSNGPHSLCTRLIHNVILME